MLLFLLILLILLSYLITIESTEMKSNNLLKTYFVIAKVENEINLKDLQLITEDYSEAVFWNSRNSHSTPLYYQ